MNLGPLNKLNLGPLNNFVACKFCGRENKIDAHETCAGCGAVIKHGNAQVPTINEMRERLGVPPMPRPDLELHYTVRK